MKLLALDAAVSSSWVLGLSAEIEALADAACSSAGVINAAELPSTSTPLLDSRALIHAQSDRRLCVS